MAKLRFPKSVKISGTKWRVLAKRNVIHEDGETGRDFSTVGSLLFEDMRARVGACSGALNVAQFDSQVSILSCDTLMLSTLEMHRLLMGHA